MSKFNKGDVCLYFSIIDYVYSNYFVSNKFCKINMIKTFFVSMIYKVLSTPTIYLVTYCQMVNKH
jgi:hypothetical protein